MLLHIDSSPRPLVAGHRGSHTRRLGARFVQRWLARRADTVRHRDLGLRPPALPSAAFIEAAFTPVARRTPAESAVLAESDALVDELIAADLIVAGVPMHNFGVPACFKAYIDNVVRVGRTFGFDRARPVPYYPLLAAGKTLVVLSARGDQGYEPGGPSASMNHVEPHIRTAFGYMGITDVRSVAIEWDEFPRDSRHAESIASAEAAVDALVDELLKSASRAAASYRQAAAPGAR
jgi:FMN-dependent NADH-azoreductase